MQMKNRLSIAFHTNKRMKFIFLLVIPIFCNAQTIDSVILKQRCGRPLLTKEDFGFKGNIKTVSSKTRSYKPNSDINENDFDVTKWFFSSAGLVLKMEQWSSSNANRTISTYHYANNRLDSITGSDERNYFEYDDKNRLVKSYSVSNEMDTSEITTFFYNSKDLISCQKSKSVDFTYEYNSNNEIIKITDSLLSSGEINSEITYTFLETGITSFARYFNFTSQSQTIFDAEKNRIKMITVIERKTSNGGKIEKDSSGWVYQYDDHKNIVNEIEYFGKKKLKWVEQKIVYYDSGQVQAVIDVTALQPFNVPTDYKKNAEAKGDLDNDGFDETVFVYDCHLESTDGLKRIMYICKLVNNQLWVWHQCTIGEISNEATSMNLDTIFILRNCIVLKQNKYFGGRNISYFTHRFRYQNSNWYLVGSKLIMETNCDGQNIHEINFSTGEIRIGFTPLQGCDGDPPKKFTKKRTMQQYKYIFSKLPLMDNLKFGENVIEIQNTKTSCYY